MLRSGGSPPLDLVPFLEVWRAIAEAGHRTAGYLVFSAERFEDSKTENPI